MSDRKIRSEKRIKQDAKKIRKKTGVSHSKALDSAVQKIGYSNYHVYQQSLKKLSSNPFVSVRKLRNELVKRAIDYVIFIPTKTGLEKSILDATAPMRELFRLGGFHDYRAQLQGAEHKVMVSAFFVSSSGIREAALSLYRPSTKKGDPRMWFRGLKGFVSENDSIAVIFYQQKPHLINLSAIDDLEFLQRFLDQVTSKPNDVAEELLNKLKHLARKHALSSSIAGNTAIGVAIENALGIAANSSKSPDYKGIEIKSSRRKKAPIRSTLFAQVADWSCSQLKSSREILEKYGYEREGGFKLYCTVSSLKSNSQGLQFKLKNNDEEVHEVHYEDGEVVVWKAELLKQRLLEKHAETFWIKAESKREDGKEFFYLKSVIHTKAPLQTQFIPLIKEGVITMDHLIKRNAKGRVSEKGPLFKILPADLDLLFPEPVEYNLLDE